LELYHILFFLLALIAEIIGTVSGFGSSLLFVPLASAFFDFQIVLGITAVFHVFSNISKIYLFREGLNKEIALKLGIPAVIFVIIGAILTNYIPQKEIELAMNFIIIALALYLLTGHHKKLQQSNQNLYAGGMISGFLAGLIGTGGAIRGITLAAFQLEKNAFISTSAIIDFGVDISRAGIYIYNGFFKVENLIFIPILIGISILGTFLGKKIIGMLSEKLFQIILLSIICLTAIAQTVQYFMK
jgi:uncharacterized membrane protein YfcA